MKRRNVQTLSLVIVTFTYLLVGAAIFDALEGTNNENALEGLIKIRSDLKEKYAITDDDFKIIEVLIEERKSHKSGPQWKFAGSFYFSLVVLALIGYGHSTPATKLGKVFTISYACLGIPIAMIMFQSIGERMNKASSVLIRRLRTWLGCQQTEASETDLILASSAMSLVSIICGAYLYHTQEGWSYFDSFYYCYITLTTIGFGDFVALQQNKSLEMRPGYVICSFSFLLWGLSSVASSVNLLVLKFMTISLEEEQQGEDEMQDVAANVDTFDDVEILPNHTYDGSADLFKLEKDDMSVCSCTCYSMPKQQMKKVSSTEGNISLLRRLMKRFGLVEEVSDSGSHYYDHETMSISNYTKLQIKRSSF
ncbi:two pore potassium channel protein sup-9 [Eurytemora carolleeae]|uniref:two pore potassium channel protein sup-9 n=1 Tax=Eurytemora carolleeae TaxID=1294199 RepID=UPI000C7722E3|nr:two pore potassium channel protein sup-9 [Eurytemora carolleeae]|eukprot:XP_023336559.1 two pore potassium channel protein sup-9-like [Eurytemora affinis]